MPPSTPEHQLLFSVCYLRFAMPAAAGRPSSGEVERWISIGCAVSSGAGVSFKRVRIGICLGALIPNRTRFLPISRMVISISSATMIFCSFLRLMINIQAYLFYKCPHLCREIPMAKKYIQFCRRLGRPIPALQFSVVFWHNKRAFQMMKYLLSTTSLILLLFCPIQGQDVRPAAATSNADVRTPTAERLLTVAGTNYLNQLALRGFNLESQGILIESLDGRSVFADLNSNVGFNPASVIKVATSFAALSKFGPEYHFETGFYADGSINKKTHTLSGNLVFASSGDPMLTSIDVSRLVREVVRADRK